MKGVRDFLFGNWRNKGVALFFALTIWYAAYRTEKQECVRVVRVVLGPQDPTKHVITRVAVATEEGGASGVAFDGSVRVAFSGPRRRIERLKDETIPEKPLRVPPGQNAFTFRPEDFGYPQEGVTITKFEPPSVHVSQEERITVTVQNLAEKIKVTNLPEGFEMAIAEVLPAGQTAELTGPASIASRCGIVINVPMTRDRFDGKAEVTPLAPDDVSAELVRRAVTVKPSQVQVRVAIRAGMDTLSVDSVRITFRIPPVKAPVKIVTDDIAGDRIPVEFLGRKDEISRLRDRVREDPGFSLGVRVPPFDPDQGGQYTFTEDTLELYGFSGIQIRQHESRRAEKKTAWSYTIVPVKEAEK